MQDMHVGDPEYALAGWPIWEHSFGVSAEVAPIRVGAFLLALRSADVRKVIREKIWALSARFEPPSTAAASAALKPEEAEVLVGSYALAQNQLRDVLVADPPVCPTRFAILSTAIDRAYVTGVLSRRFHVTLQRARSTHAWCDGDA